MGLYGSGFRDPRNVITAGGIANGPSALPATDLHNYDPKREFLSIRSFGP